MRLAMLSVLALAVGCGNREPAAEAAASEATLDSTPVATPSPSPVEPPGQPPTKTPADTEPKPSVEPTPTPTTRPPAATPEQAARLRRELLDLLAAGRKSAKAGDYQAAITSFELARAIEPSDPTVLGELGWAAFKTGNLSLARASTIRATVQSQDPKQLGALYYNLGRVHEEQSDLVAAALAYRTSLERRPNGTVEARLAQVLERCSDAERARINSGSAADVPVEEPTPSDEGEPLDEPDEDDELDEPDEDAPPRPSQSPGAIASAGLARQAEVGDLSLACADLVANRCADFRFGDETCSCDPTLLETPPDDASWGLLALHVGKDAHVVWYPVVQTDAGWVLFREIAWAFNPGSIGVWESVLFEATRVETSTKDPALVFTFGKSRSDSDMSLNEIEEERYRASVVCVRNERGARCTMPLVLEYEFDRKVEFPEDDDAEHPGLPIRKSYTAQLRFDSRALVFEDVVVQAVELGRLSTAAGVLLGKGRQALEDLLGG